MYFITYPHLYINYDVFLFFQTYEPIQNFPIIVFMLHNLTLARLALVSDCRRIAVKTGPRFILFAFCLFIGPSLNCNCVFSKAKSLSFRRGKFASWNTASYRSHSDLRILTHCQRLNVDFLAELPHTSILAYTHLGRGNTLGELLVPSSWLGRLFSSSWALFSC